MKVSKIRKGKAFGRILKDRKPPAHFDQSREWMFHATKGWRSYKKEAA